MRLVFLFALLAAAEALVGQASETGTDERSHDEDPQMAECRATSEDGL